MSGLKGRSSRLAAVMLASIGLTLMAGLTLAEMESDLTPLSVAEADQVVGGQASCNSSGFVALEALKEGCSAPCSARKNSTYTNDNTGTRGTNSETKCQDSTGKACGTRIVALGVCAT